MRDGAGEGQDYEPSSSLRVSRTSVSNFVGAGKRQATAHLPRDKTPQPSEHSQARETGLVLSLMGCGSHESWPHCLLGLPRWRWWSRTHLPMQETQETQVRSLGWEDPLEQDVAIHSSILFWRIPWTEEPGGLHSIGSQKVRHN